MLTERQSRLIERVWSETGSLAAFARRVAPVLCHEALPPTADAIAVAIGRSERDVANALDVALRDSISARQAFWRALIHRASEKSAA